MNRRMRTPFHSLPTDIPVINQSPLKKKIIETKKTEIWSGWIGQPSTFRAYIGDKRSCKWSVSISMDNGSIVVHGPSVGCGRWAPKLISFRLRPIKSSLVISSYFGCRCSLSQRMGHISALLIREALQMQGCHTMTSPKYCY